MKTIILFIIAVIEFATGEGRLIPGRGCTCTKELRWVCGSNGVTYSNPCIARCKGASIRHYGSCRIQKSKNCLCTKELNTVCGNDGATYSNPCLARCHGASVIYGGRCEGKPINPIKPIKQNNSLCPCTKELNWVCGRDGFTYANPCLARCKGMSVAHLGKC